MQQPHLPCRARLGGGAATGLQHAPCAAHPRRPVGQQDRHLPVRDAAGDHVCARVRGPEQRWGPGASTASLIGGGGAHKKVPCWPCPPVAVVCCKAGGGGSKHAVGRGARPCLGSPHNTQCAHASMHSLHPPLQGLDTLLVRKRASPWPLLRPHRSAPAVAEGVLCHMNALGVAPPILMHDDMEAVMVRS